MAEVNTTRDERGYKLGCLPFLLVIIIFIISAVFILLWITGNHSHINDINLFDLDNFKRIIRFISLNDPV